MQSKTLSILTILIFLAIGFFVLNSDVKFLPEENVDLIGLWESDDDSLFTREFFEDSVIDRYNSDEDVETIGVWEYVSAEEVVEKGFPNMGDIAVIKIQFTEDPEPLYFSIVATGEDKVSMVFLSGNGVLNFTKIEKEEVYSWLNGYITWGHEVREFESCDGDEYWIDGSSKVIDDISEAGEMIQEEFGPYSPFYVEIMADFVEAPEDGFGADYDESVQINIFENKFNGNCEIKISSPEKNGKITSPIKITGEALGIWFFEADFPVTLTDWDGKIIAEGYVSAKGDWMTEEMVAFEGELEFEKPEYGERGTLIFMKDNPSDILELDASYEIPILFE